MQARCLRGPQSGTKAVRNAAVDSRRTLGHGSSVTYWPCAWRSWSHRESCAAAAACASMSIHAVMGACMVCVVK